MTTNWTALLPDEDYRFSMRFHREPVEHFFGPTANRDAELALREGWLERSPQSCVAVTERARPLLAELATLSQAWGFSDVAGEADDFAFCLALGRQIEPDFLLLQTRPDGIPHLEAACVCFPSSWDLGEKIGHPVGFIHNPVPGLNSQLGPAIGQFLERLKPGTAWRRANWGLSRSPEWNQHPTRGLPRLDAAVSVSDVWFRVEHQALVRLPGSGVLFGIRLSVHPLADLIEIPEARTGLRRGLRTMPEDVAAYKGVASARERILSFLPD